MVCRPSSFIQATQRLKPVTTEDDGIAHHIGTRLIDAPGFCGFMSILSSLRYCLGPADDHTNMYIALAFIPFGLFFDFMDGKVARWRGKSSLMGQELDSLADLVRSPLYLSTLRSSRVIPVCA